MKFENRKTAAEKLADALKAYEGQKDALILAIPRGALEIGEVLRERLKLPLDIVVTKKIGAPGNEEFAIGVVDPEGRYQTDEKSLLAYGIPMSYVEQEAERLKHVIKRRYEDYRGSQTPPEVKGKTCIVVDDGIATGHTTMAAIDYLRRKKAKKVVLAVPVASADSTDRLRSQVDDMICLQTPEDFYAVGQFYKDFPQVSDEEAIRILGIRNQ